MHRKQAVSFVSVALLLLLLFPFFVEAQGEQKERFTSNQEFGHLKGLFESFDFSEEFIVSLLRDDGFTRQDESTWILRDDQGILRVKAYPTQRSFILDFFPVSQSPIPPAVLAALISKSESIHLDGGNTLQLNLSSENRSLTGKPIRALRGLTFTIDGGLFVKTSATIEWPEAK